jgi:hypothetical protein
MAFNLSRPASLLADPKLGSNFSDGQPFLKQFNRLFKQG